jgi:energy-coupling factor transporter ATP-binding protein EcfA2
MMSLLWKKSGILSHGCGLIKGNKTFVFMGDSGAGKTTISKILNRNGLSILSDDRIIIRKKRNSFFSYGTPWAGEGKFFSSKTAPLDGIFFLYHGKKNKLARMPVKEALSRILSCAFIPYWDKTATGSSMDTSIDLAKKIPCYKIYFLPDDSAFKFLRKHLNDRNL